MNALECIPVLNFGRLSLDNTSKAIVKPTITRNFELKEATTADTEYVLVHGKPHEDPRKHVMEFIELRKNFHYQNVSDEYIKLALFPFSFIEEAKGVVAE
ncbi:hypothetical protein HAX54_032106 [Datura stramonium]|uniref:Uncharacterized protein n=1 Tax=Datura stramonium TaxID=4076 RepID=A0ABS8VCT6_DATST|nr:hypothetical protein [Datura stramonium]